MSLPVVLRAAQPYADAETLRLTAPGPTTDTLPDFSGLPNITYRDGVAHLLIDPKHQARKFDVPMAFVLKIGEALGGNLLLTNRLSRKVGAPGRDYVRLDFGQRGIYANRIVKNPPIGVVVRETGDDFRSHLPEHLTLREAPLRDGPSKHVNGRADAVEAILAAYDKADAATQATISRHGLQALLEALLAIADARAAERLRKQMLQVVLKRTDERRHATHH